VLLAGKNLRVIEKVIATELGSKMLTDGKLLRSLVGISIIWGEMVVSKLQNECIY